MKRHLPAYVYARGPKGYLYFIRPGICERTHDKLGTPEFATTYARLMRGKSVTPTKTMRKMIRAYLDSPDFAALAANTKKSYTRHLRYFDEVMGDVDPRTIRPAHVEDMREALSDKPTDANRKVSCLSALFSWGLRKDWVTSNPAKDVPLKHTHKKPHMPWPDAVVKEFRETATGKTLLLFELLIGTGQRIGDVLKMQWGHIEGDEIRIKQQKTGAEIWVTFPARLKRILAETPRQGLFIACQDNGKPMSYPLAWKLIREVRAQIADGMTYDVHGLRATAASDIIKRPGMTLEHVRAITGHSGTEMARRYSMQAEQRARAKEAQERRK